MKPISVSLRWLTVLLGLALVLDVVIILDGMYESLLALPGAVVVAACAVLAVREPILGVIFGALTLVVSSVLMREGHISTSAIGLYHITLTEVVAGGVLIVVVVWRLSTWLAAGGVAVVVAAYVVSMELRANFCVASSPFCFDSYGLVDVVTTNDVFVSQAFGFVLLAGAVAAGIHLRRSARQQVETELATLVRKQWPLGAAIALLATLELSDRDYGSGITLLGAVAAGACAFFAPKHPVRNAWLGAAAILFTSLLASVSTGGFRPYSFTAAGASMALIAYVVRYAEPKPAVRGALAVAGALLISAVSRDSNALHDGNLTVLAFFLLVAVVTGWYFRARDRERHQSVRAVITTAQQGERLALARELHDVVAHHVTGIVVQAQAALHVAETNPGAATPALEKIERSGTEALTAMRVLVGSLRDNTLAAVDQATTDLTADIHALVEHFTGPPVDLEVDLPEKLPHETGRSVLRLVQESLTNVGKHAPDATTVSVRVAPAEDTLHLRVSDNGTTRPVNPPGGSGGYGLVGMRERAELLGGRFEAGPSGEVGWLVEAWLPLRKEGS